MKSEAQWRELLTPEQFHILREHGTERPFTGEYVSTTDDGVYRCVACGVELFSSQSKFDAHCGWPSFDEVIDAQSVDLLDDYSVGTKRIEVRCKNCGGHLGHVFPDGPTETGLRYCINSVALKLERKLNERTGEDVTDMNQLG